MVHGRTAEVRQRRAVLAAIGQNCFNRGNGAEGIGMRRQTEAALEGVSHQPALGPGAGHRDEKW